MPSGKIILTVLVLSAACPAWAQGDKPLIDNDRVIVWEWDLAKGQSAPPAAADMDTVVMVKNADPTQDRAYFYPKGSAHIDTAGDAGLHEVIVGLKGGPRGPMANPTPYPLAFPREGSVQLLANDKVLVHRFCWTPNVPTKMHFHDKDVVVAYHYDAPLKSVTPDGAVTQNDFKAGQVRWNTANRTHYEVLAAGRQCAMMTELK